MLKGNFDYSVGSDVDFENLVADIGFDSKFVAMLTQETGFKDLRIRIYPPKDAEYWDFRFDEFEEIIQKARKNYSG
jgi:phage pi2 protein 07